MGTTPPSPVRRWRRRPGRTWSSGRCSSRRSNSSSGRSRCGRPPDRPSTQGRRRVYVPRVAHEVVGRGAELAALEPFLALSRDGLAALVFEGEAGIGKSTVWQAAADLAVERGWQVLISRPARSEQGLTLGGLVDLLGGAPDDVLARLPAPQRDALAVALLRATPEGAS